MAATHSAPIATALPPASHGARRSWASLIINRRALKRLLALAVIVAIPLTYGYIAMVRMPGQSHAGPLPPLSPAQAALSIELRRDVEALASGIGKRSTFHPRSMADAARHIISELQTAGFAEHEETFVERGSRVPNIAVEIAAAPGSPTSGEVVVVGAHYDSYQGTPGADDNASGVAATLALARRFRDPSALPLARALRFVFFVNEEPPSFMTDDMGSLVYARHCRARGDRIVAMLSLETLGFYTDIPGYQTYPPLVHHLYPDRGDFIAFIGRYTDRDLVKRCIGEFRARAAFPSEGAALPATVPGVGWSDHWAFWQCGYPAIMVTDTANYRNPHYHIDSDTPDKLDYDRTARVVEGLESVVRALCSP